MTAELRCGHNLHGVLENGSLEVKCRNPKCGARSGVVVLHRFDLRTGDLVSTKTYQDPRRKEGRR